MLSFNPDNQLLEELEIKLNQTAQLFLVHKFDVKVAEEVNTIELCML
jgi:hypothetical protein